MWFGPGGGGVGPGHLLDGEASGVGTVVGGELVGDGGVVNLYHRRVMVSVHQRGSSGHGPGW